MKPIVVAAIATLAVTMMTNAKDVCQSLTAIPVGSSAPKAPGFNNVGASGSCTNGLYTLEGNGHDFYWGWDRGAFAYFEVVGSEDFTFTAKINGSVDDLFCKSEKIGICAREGLVGNDRAIQLRYDGFFGGSEANAQVSWFYRHTPGSTTSEFCSVENRSSCFFEDSTGLRQFDSYLRMSRQGGKYKLFVGTDGTNWTETATDRQMGFSMVKTCVGLIVSCGNFGNSLASVPFSNIDCSGPGCPSPSSVRSLPIANLQSGRLRAFGNGGAISIVIPGTRREQLALFTQSGAIAANLTRHTESAGSVVYRSSGSLTPGLYVVSSRHNRSASLGTVMIVGGK